MQHYAIDSKLTDSIQFEIKLKPFVARLEAGDRFVVFERKDEIVFVAKGEVVSIADRIEAEEGSSEPVTVRLVQISEVEPLDEPRSLIVVAGSLEKIYRYIDPQRHFIGRNILKLSKNDFQTIDTGRLYLSRSVFRFLFSALPVALQAEFVRQHIEQMSLSPDGEIQAYGELAPLIVEFVSDRISEPLQMMNQIATLHKKLGNVAPPIQDLYLTTDEDLEARKTDPIAFGRTATASTGIMGAKSLFPTDQIDESLLSEARELLMEIDDNEERKWQDPIF